MGERGVRLGDAKPEAGVAELQVHQPMTAVNFFFLKKKKKKKKKKRRRRRRGGGLLCNICNFNKHLKPNSLPCSAVRAMIG